MNIIQIEQAFITLQQLLKSEGIIGSGGYAKTFLAEQQVVVNEIRETRRGRKLYPGDTVTWSTFTWQIAATPRGDE